MRGAFPNSKSWLTMGCTMLFGFTSASQARNSKVSDEGKTRLPYCSRVKGRYGVFADNDLLRIDGSRHLVVAISDELDRELEKLGWEDHVAVGTFQICYARNIDPTLLTRGDRVEIVGFSSIEFVKGAH